MNGWMDYDHTPQIQTTSTWDEQNMWNNVEQAVFEGLLQKSATATAGQTLLSLR